MSSDIDCMLGARAFAAAENQVLSDGFSNNTVTLFVTHTNEERKPNRGMPAQIFRSGKS